MCPITRNSGGIKDIVSQQRPITSSPGNAAIILFSLGILIFWAAMYVYTPVFPVYAGVLGADLTTVGLAVGAYGLTQMLLRIPLGMWSDSLGKRRVFVVAGMLICALAAVGFAFSRTPAGLIVFRGVMGIAASTWVCSTVLFTSYFAGRHPSVPLSIMTFASSLGQLLGVASGGVIAQQLGWIAPFWASFILSLIGAVILAQSPEDSTAKAMPVSRDGILRTARSRSLILACILGAIMQYVTWSTVNGFTPVLAADRLGASRAQLGYLTTTGLIAYSAVALFTPRLVRIIGEAPALVLSFSLMAVGVLPTPLVTVLPALAALQVIGGVGRGFVYTLLLSLSIKETAAQDRASAMGAFQAVYALGMFIGPSLSGSIADALGLDAVFVLCGVLCLACLPIVWIAIQRTRVQPR